jgi:uncharacterized membrane protein YccF (DUF307 family)
MGKGKEVAMCDEVMTQVVHGVGWVIKAGMWFAVIFFALGAAKAISDVAWPLIKRFGDWMGK